MVAEAGRSQVQGLPGLHSENLSQKTNKKKKKESKCPLGKVPTRDLPLKACKFKHSFLCFTK
jgi:hypothetical protein